MEVWVLFLKSFYKGDRRKYGGSYDNYVGSSLPYWMRLSDGGIGLHASNYVHRYPRSNGCVRMPLGVRPSDTIDGVVSKKVAKELIEKDVHNDRFIEEYMIEHGLRFVMDYNKDRWGFKHSNYDIDESGFYLADIESIKEIVTDQEKENNLVVDLAKVEFFTPPDFNELAALANFGGWVLRVTIVCPPKMKKINF